MTHELDGTWVNDVGSRMEITASAGVLRGTYHTAVGRPEADDGFALAGVVNGDMSAFTVDFGDHGSVCAWTGRLVQADDGAALHTLWHLVRDHSDSGESLPAWASTLAGSAVFRRVSSRP